MSTSKGLIILGNTGVGKSFLGNLILREEAFVHECSPDSVTHETEFREYADSQIKFSIFNIPGLIEDDQQAVERNKVQIYKAFELRPQSVVAFVFSGGAGGRLRDEDIVAFQAINNAYLFKTESLLLIINDLPPQRSNTYEGATIMKLKNLLNLRYVNVCFLNRIDTRSQAEINSLREQLLKHVILCFPHVHTKKSNIELTTDLVRKLKEESKRAQQQFQNQLTQLQDQVKEMQKKYDDLQHQTKRQPEVHHHYHAGSVPVPPVYSASAGGYGNTPLLHPSNPGSPAQVARICSALGIRK